MSEQHKIWNEGTTQRARYIQALTKKNFDVDERHFEVLVKQVADHAAKITFFNGHNQPDGYWDDLINADEIVALAQLLLVDVKGFENEYYARYAEATDLRLSPQKRQEATDQVLEVTNQAYAKLSQWYTTLHTIKQDQVHYPIFKEWSAAIQTLRSTKDFQTFEKKVFMEKYVLLDDKAQVGELKKVNYFFQQLVKTILFLNSQYKRFLNLSKQHQSHSPHHALLFAFIELLDYAKKSINTFHQRHMDYYYEEHIHLKPRPAKPDMVTLQFELEDGFQNHLLPEETAFLAGQDDEGKDLIYKTTEELEVSKSTVADLKGVFVSRVPGGRRNKNPHVSLIRVADYTKKDNDEPWAIMNLSRQSFGSHHQHSEIGFAVSSPELSLKEGVRTIKLSFECRAKNELRTLNVKFVRGKKNRGDVSVASVVKAIEKKEPTIGEFLNEAFELTAFEPDFVISENFIEELLTFNDGELANQKVLSYLATDDPETVSKCTIQQLIDRLSEETAIPSRLTFPDLISELMEETDPDMLEKKFSKTLKNAFNVRYTSEQCWIDIKPVSVAFSNHQLEFILVLPQSHLPLEVNTDSRFDQPTIKFTLNPNAAFYGYDFFERLQFTKVSGQINVKNVRNLVLYNQIGPVSGDGPFLPFGPTPNNYSYLLVGNQEVFGKQFSKLRLNIDWMDLPTEAGGFDAYYNLYGQKLNNQSFKARISNLSGGEWVPKEGMREEVDLFEGKQTLENRVRFQLSTTKLAPSQDYDWKPDVLEYSGNSQRGFLKVQLSAPKFSFGHQQYPNLLSKMAIENAKSMTGLLSGILKKKTEMNMPNPPYTPKIDKISLDYITSFEMSFDSTIGQKKNIRHSFYHLLPFGGYIRNPVRANGLQLIPSFDYEGALYLGIKDFKPPGTLNLFFNLKETDAVQDPDPQGKGSLDWHFLFGNDWVRLKPQQVSSDTTDNFLHTGIVKLDISYPGRPKKSTVADEELFWIMVSSKNNTQIMGEVIDITTNAVVAQFTPESNDQGVNHSIEPNTISESIADLPAISKINQPLKSFGGLDEELRSHFYVRVSERLRHKNRCVNAYDYERIILEAFPDISKVLCIDSYDWKTNQPKSGKVLIVLVPVIKDRLVANVTTPSTSVKTLRKVRELIQSKISPFVQVDVINPEYEHMRVFADVKFEKGKSAGFYLKKLNEELRAFISPWIVDPMAEPLFQRRFPIEDIQSFIQSRKYVEFVTKVSSVKVDRRYEEGAIKEKKKPGPFTLRDTGVNPDRDNETRGRYPWSIVTTARVHQLHNMDLEKEIAPDHAGYEELYLNEDFVLRGETDN